VSPRLWHCTSRYVGSSFLLIKSDSTRLVQVFERQPRQAQSVSISLDALKNTLCILPVVLRPDGRSFIHCLRSPMNYASSPAEPRLYGLGNTNSTNSGSLYWFNDRTLRTNLNSPATTRMCHTVHFFNKTNIPSVPAFHRFVLCNIVEAKGRKALW